MLIYDEGTTTKSHGWGAAKKWRVGEVRFEDLHDEWLAAHRDGRCIRSNDGYDAWMGAGVEDWSELMRRGRDDKYVAQIERQIDDLLMEIPVPSRTPVESAYGSNPIVGAHLAGSPLSMRHYEDDPSTSVPVKIYMGLTVASGCSHASIIKHKVVSCALAAAISRVRSVELYAYSGMDRNGMSGFVTVPLGVSPVDLGRLSITCHPAFFRRMFFALTNVLCETRGTYFPFNTVPAKVALQPGPDDILCPSLRLNNAGRMLSDPVNWIKEQINKVVAGESSDIDVSGNLG